MRDELAVRAARAGRSLQEYLRLEVIELARRPSVDGLLAGSRERKRATDTRLPAERILTYRYAEPE